MTPISQALRILVIVPMCNRADPCGTVAGDSSYLAGGFPLSQELDDLPLVSPPDIWLSGSWPRVDPNLDAVTL